MSKIFLTKQGLKKLKENLAEKIDQLKNLRDEKAHAYTASGDGWHDNPGWTQLGQQEELLALELLKIQERLNNAYLIDLEKMDKTKVGLGCTVEFILYKKDSLKRMQRLTVAGSGESDIKKQIIAIDSPLGKALNTMCINEEKTV